MMTLMPVAAFAETVDGNNITVGELDAAKGKVAINVKGITAMNTTGTVYVYASAPTTKAVADPVVAGELGKGETSITLWAPVAELAGKQLSAVAKAESAKPTEKEINEAKAEKGPIVDKDQVSTEVDNNASYVSTVKSNPTVGVNDNVKISFDFRNSGDYSLNSKVGVYVWAVEKGSNEPTSALKGTTTVNGLKNVLTLNGVETGVEKTISFSRAGEYTIYAALETGFATSGTTQAEMMKNASPMLKTDSSYKTITVENDATSDAKNKVEVVTPSGDNKKYEDGATILNLTVDADSVEKTGVKLKFYDENDKVLSGKEVKIETNSSNITVSKEKATTDRFGTISFDVAGYRDGDYKIYVSIGSFEVVINVTVGATSPAYINVVKEPANPLAAGEYSDLSNEVRFAITDINGNALTYEDIQDAVRAGKYSEPKAFTSDKEANENYVAILSQPTASKLENSDVKLVVDNTKSYLDKNDRTVHPYMTLDFGTSIVAEGDYEVKVTLDNGKYVTVKFTIKEFQTPVEIELVYAAPSVELGGTAVVDKLNYVDANGVRKTARGKVDLAATGYAIQNFVTEGKEQGKLTVKSDEKYLDSKITVTAIDSRYNLTKSVDLKVVDEAAALAFSTKTAEVNINNRITVTLVDSEGNRVAFGNKDNAAKSEINYVVLDKPEGAKVSVATSSADNNLLTAGSFVMNLTSNKVGNVTVQAVAKITEVNTSGSTNNVTKYYTGTQIFAVGTGSVGDVVVMSIGSNEIIVNDAKATIDAAPMVQNDRTYVPFRALAEAFGAEVAYDEATQAVTAELNGVKVVMTIGSATYTVNGEEKTMDVAPFINGSRTMVPVRFAAEAFGIKVIPTYDENGATADILFNL